MPNIIKWTLQSSVSNPAEYQLISDDGKTLNFKFSRSQHSIRMRFNEHYGVFVVDEGSFNNLKFAIRNVYGSEIGTVTKGAWRETTGSLFLNDSSLHISYEINKKESSIEIIPSNAATTAIKLAGELTEENYMLALIVFSWMQTVTSGHTIAA